MVIDELVLPLQRIWCLFEVYQTICLSQTSHFQGLLLCTSTGVLQEGQAGTDVAVAVAKRVTDLDIRGAQASSEEDRLMIHALIEQMDGGFETMNTFVRETWCKESQILLFFLEFDTPTHAHLIHTFVQICVCVCGTSETMQNSYMQGPQARCGRLCLRSYSRMGEA